MTFLVNHSKFIINFVILVANKEFIADPPHSPTGEFPLPASLRGGVDPRQCGGTGWVINLNPVIFIGFIVKLC